MEFLQDLWLFMKERKKFWLVPMVVVLLLLGLLIVFGGSSAIAPFIYTLF
jgi:competence protein ComGC